MFKEANGQYSMARIISFMLILTGIFILLYSVLNGMVEYMTHGTITAGLGTGLKAGSKLTEQR